MTRECDVRSRLEFCDRHKNYASIYEGTRKSLYLDLHDIDPA